MDDKLGKARKARWRSCARDTSEVLYNLRYLLVISVTALLILVLRHRYRPPENNVEAHREEFVLPNVAPQSKVDYNDYQQIQQDLERTGPGEQGKPATLSPTDSDSELRQKLYFQNGFNALLSDKISVNRSVADLRHPRCRTLQYSRSLPSVSVIVPFYEEHWTTLLRTVYSVVRRSPARLLKEIILVDDGSTKPFLKRQLDDYVEKHLKSLVKVVRHPERVGLITARLTGAKLATGDVLLFLDSHIEAGINWLPPLLEPIARDPRTCVCPFIDVIMDDTFEFVPQDQGARGAFDWNMLYKRLPLRPEDLLDPTKPFPSPVMAGGLFAISAWFFWELGGYDEQLEIWGAEQYELSFKIWMCGGQLIDAPCSRVGHIYRSYSPFPNAKTYDFVAKNHKRVAEVWMDEYKHYVYRRDPQRFAIDAGDLSKMKHLRRRLHCKPFRWFMETIAPDLIEWYPLIEPENFASGVIQSQANGNLCVEVESISVGGKRALLAPCASDKIAPERPGQNFQFTWRRDIKSMLFSSECLDVTEHSPDAQLQLIGCHNQQGNQLFQYDVDTKQIYAGRDKAFCLEAQLARRQLTVNVCNEALQTQHWRIGHMNVQLLKNWHKHGAKLVD
ncbi:N-acetylgalactosaminyltransferase 6-like [Anopheles cruzii]|uniref:N-acetylgalactosaminyltransferase 6-like n=1 Tax=Anopheles cruzii TaxID=68878 RepID=UPI0022EC1CF5|nr:N-acetylgalactosaminyltransferase 6-like [Anopheles cruzii]